MDDAAKFRERMLALAAQVGQGKGEPAHETLERARSFAVFTFGQTNASTILQPWEWGVIAFGAGQAIPATGFPTNTQQAGSFGGQSLRPEKKDVA